MKKTILLTIVILLPIFIYSQVGFQKFYGRQNTYQEFRSILPMPDGGYLAAGTDGRGGHGFWLVKTDSFGTKEFEKKFGTDLYLYFLSKMPDGGYLLSGLQNISTTNRQVFVIRINANFEQIWSKKITDNDIQNHVFSPHIESDGSITLPVTTYYDSTTSTQITRLHADGNIEWEIFPTQLDKVYGITATQDNHLLFHGEQTDSLDNDLTYILKTDRDGNIIWTKNITGSYSVGDFSYIVTKDESTNSHFILTNRVFNKLDDDGNIIWQYYFPNYGSRKLEKIDDNTFLNYRINDIHELTIENNNVHDDLVFDTILYSQSIFFDGFSTPENNHIYAGRLFNTNYGRDAYIIKTDENQNVLWTSHLGDHAPLDDETGFAGKQTPDNGYIMGGRGRFPSTGYDLYLIKTDSVGNVEWELTHDAGGGFPTNDKGILDICLTNENDIIVAGWSGLFPDSSDLTIIKVNLFGNIIWDKKYKFRTDSKHLNCNILPNNNLAFSYSNHENMTNLSPSLFVLDSNGDSVFLKTLPPDSILKIIHKTILTSDEKLLNTGIKNNYDSLWVYKTDLFGNTIQDASIPINGKNSSILYDIIETSEHNYFVPYSNEGGDSLFVLEVSSDLSSYEENLLSKDFAKIENVQINKITNNEYLLSFLTENESFFIIRINEDFEILDIHEYDKKPNQTISDTQTANDNSLILFGDATNINTQDWHLIKTLPNGVNRTINIQPFGSVNIYPNPSSSELFFDFTSYFEGEIEISIIDLKGQLIRSFSEIKNSAVFEKKVDIGHLPSGAYCIIIKANGRGISRVWFKH